MKTSLKLEIRVLKLPLNYKKKGYKEVPVLFLVALSLFLAIILILFEICQTIRKQMADMAVVVIVRQALPSIPLKR